MDRPLIRADCVNGPRPCPFISCHHHMIWAYTKTKPWGQGEYHPIEDMTDNEVVEWIETMPETCVLDVSDGLTLQKIADLIGTSRQCVDQTINGLRRRAYPTKGAVKKVANYF